MAIMTSRAVDLPAGEPIPALGQGTWHLGQGRHPRADELQALRTGIDLGMTLIDTAEMYGEGTTEQLVGEAIAGRPSLRRLAADQLDLSLLHWRGIVPLDETVAAFEELRAAGLIRHWGVSNFDLPGLRGLVRSRGGGAVQLDQVLYNLTRRAIGGDLLPWGV